MSTPPPNILFLMSDDHRHDAMACAGDPLAHTPHLDALAARGMRCTHAHIMGGHSPAVCVPSRACMNTGCTPFRASESIDGKIGSIPADRPLMGEWFHAAGYETFHTGKWHLEREACNRSFETGDAMFMGGMHKHYQTPIHSYDPSGEYPKETAQPCVEHSSEVFADAAIRFIERAEHDRPCFVSCCFTAPHDPRNAPPEWHQRFPASAVTLPENAWPQHPFDNGELMIRDERLAAHPRDPAEIRQHIADYQAMIGHMDEQIGRILAALEASGLADNTIVVYTADHGLAVGQHGLMGKQNCYDHSIRIPLIAAGPGINGGQTWDGMVYGFDVFPTLCAWTGIAPPTDLDGQSFAAQGPGRDHIYSVYRNMMASVSERQWKLIRTYPNPGLPESRVQLFDRIADPLEMNDRAQDPECAAIRKRLEALLLAQQEAVGDPLLAVC